MSVAILAFHQPVWAEPNLKTAAYFSGAGTEESPYLVSSANHLAQFSADVRAGVDYDEVYFELTQDIDFEGQTLLPIGDVENPFRGVFDGAGYTISNIVIDATDTLTLGLFGATEGAQIKNLGIKDIEISSIDVATDETQTLIGGVCGIATNTTISECFIKNQSDKTIDARVTKRASVGGICGMLASGSNITNCFADVDIVVDANTISPIDCFVGGVVGNISNSHVLNSYSAGNLTCGNLISTNQNALMFEGGVAGFVQGTYSTTKNCFNLGDVAIDSLHGADTIFAGAIIGGIGSNSSQTPDAGNLNFCHYLQTSEVNNGLSAIASNVTYNLTGLVFKAQNDVIFFQRTTDFLNENSYDVLDGFDFDEVWLIEQEFPELQLFAYYDIQIEQVENLTMSVVGGEEISENTYKFKAGQTVVINATIEAGVEKFYHIQTWRRNQGEIESTAGLEQYEFVCSYSTQGTYSVVLKENTFTLKIVIPTEFSSIASIKFESSLVGSSTFQTQLLYGREVSIEAVLGTSENAQNYAFAGWFAGSEATTTIDWDSSVLTFKIGDNVVPFDEDLNIVLTPKFTRDICRFTIEFDASMGKVRLYETDEFSGDAVANKPIKKGQFLDIEAECLEGYEFLGWFREGDLDPLSKNLKLSGYEIKDDTQNLIAKFKSIDAEEEVKKGLSGWAIFGIVAGCLAVVGAVVLTVVLVKKKGSYKSNWNF